MSLILLKFVFTFVCINPHKYDMIEMIKKSVQMECDKTIMTVVLMIYVVGWLLRGNTIGSFHSMNGVKMFRILLSIEP